MNTHALFKAALEASWQASLVILLILLLRPLLGLRVPASWRSLLWTLVLLRLLVPAFLSLRRHMSRWHDGIWLHDPDAACTL